MPAKTEKQKKFFGAVMGAKKGQSKVSGEAKKVAKELPKKEIKKFLKKEGEEDEQSVAKQIKKTGKATIKGPNVKERKKFAPTTKVEAPKKGKGSYNRKETFDEDEQYPTVPLKRDNKPKGWRPVKREIVDKDYDPNDNTVPLKMSDEERSQKLKDRRKPLGTKRITVENTNIANFIDAIFTKNYADADKYIKQAVESKLQSKIEQELTTPLFQ